MERLYEECKKWNCTNPECSICRAIAAVDASEAQPTDPDALIDALHSFLAPGVTTWTMTRADLPRIVEFFERRWGPSQGSERKETT